MTVFTVRPDQRLETSQAGRRRMRLRSRLRIELGLLGSGLLHLLVLLAILLTMLPHPPQEPASSNPVTVIFEPSLPSSRQDQPPGSPIAAAPDAGPQIPPPPGIEAIPAPPSAAGAARAEPLPVPPPPPVLTSPAPTPVPLPAPSAAAPILRPPLPRPPALHPRSEPGRAAQPAESSLSAPMQFSFGGATVDALGRRPTGRRNAIDPTIGPDIATQVGSPPTDLHRPDASIKVTGAQVGSDWAAMLHAWWNQHGYYPPQAAQNGEDGTVRIHVLVDRYGHVLGVDLIGKSGSQWLDLAAQAVFRGATLPPFPPATPEPRADLELTIRYLLDRR